MRRLPLPEHLSEIKKLRFRNPDCLGAFLDACEALIARHPAAGLEVAQHAPDYLKRVFPEGGGDDFAMRVHGVIGSAHLAAGEIGRAEEAYARASTFAGGPEESAVLACRVAHLRCEQQRWDEALAAAEQAVSYAEQRYDPDLPLQETDRFSLAGTLVTRANVHGQSYRFGAGSLQEAASDLKRALTVCTRKTPQTRLAAVHNLGSVAASAWIGDEAGILHPSQVTELMRRVRRSLHREKKIRHRSVIHAKTRWVLGLALAQEAMGLTRRAESYLRGARDDLIALESYPDAVMLSLDFGWWLFQERQWAKLRAMAGEVVTAPWGRRLPTEWRTALELWRQGVWARGFEQGVLEHVYRTVRGIDLDLPEIDETAHRWETSIGW